MPNFNQCTIIGHLVRDPETRHLAGGSSVTESAVAVSEKWTNKQTGEKNEKTMFLDLVIWGPSGERFAEWYKQGRAIMVSGKLEQDTWDDKTSGAKRSKIKLNVRDHQACGPEKSGQRGQTSSSPTSPTSDSSNAGQTQPAMQSGLPGMPPGDDNIPF